MRDNNEEFMREIEAELRQPKSRAPLALGCLIITAGICAFAVLVVILVVAFGG